MATTTTLHAGPVRDRRRGKRILTMKNAFWTFGALLLAFALISAASEFRKPKTDDFGRLYSTRVPTTTVAPVAEHPVVAEAPAVKEVSFADPLSLDTINRQVVLGTENVANTKAAERDAWVAQQQQAQATAIAGGNKVLGFSEHPAEHRGTARVAITGGAAGVSVAPAN